MRPIDAFKPSLLLPPLVGLSLLACQPRETEQVACPPSDPECVGQPSPRATEALLPPTEGNSGDGVSAAEFAPSRPDRAFWLLDAGGTRVEGTIALVGKRDGRLAIQLVSDDAVNLWLVVPDDGTADRRAETVLLAFGRGDRCHYDSEDGVIFSVRMEQMEGPWVSGRFDGPVLCEGEVASTRASGTFRVSSSR